MKKLADISTDHEFEPGTTLRWYGVKRVSKKKDYDYYDLVLFDANEIKKNTWALLNCTHDSSHNGHLYAVFDCKSREGINARILQEHFEEEEVFVLT